MRELRLFRIGGFKTFDYLKNVFLSELYFLFTPSYKLTVFLFVKYNLIILFLKSSWSVLFLDTFGFLILM